MSGLSCLQNSDFPAGACTATCGSGGEVCPSGTVCSPALSSGSSYCLQSCATTSCSDSMLCTTTADGQLCLSPVAAVSSPISCAPPQLVAGALVGPPADPGCQTPVVNSALPPADVQSLGTHVPGDTVPFQVPSGAVGLSVVSQLASGDNGYIDCQGQVLANVPVPTPILTPGGATFFDEVALYSNPPLDLTTAPFVFFFVEGQQPFTAAITFPNTSAGLDIALDGGLPGGQWNLVVNDYANAFQVFGCDAGTARNSYDVSVVVTPGPLPSTGQLGVDVYLVTSEFTASSAVANPAMQSMAARFGTLYENAGICVSTVTFHDVPAWAKSKYSSVNVDDSSVQDPCSDFREMMTLAQPGRTMALFFLDEMVASGLPAGDEIVGKDGAIPGMATFNGTIAGGSAVSVADLTATTGCNSTYQPASCGPDLVATISAHETGHFLGLFHPTEETGDSWDPLVDTASCVCPLCELTPSLAAACSNNPDGGEPTFVENSVCNGASQQCGGANLLMFWILSSDMKGDISPEEARVMRANPLISAP